MTTQQEDHIVNPLPLPHSHLGEEGIINISSDVLIESQCQGTTIKNTTLSVVAGLIARQKPPCLDTFPVAPSNFARTFDVEQIVLNAQRQAALMIGESIKAMVLKTSNECLPSLKGKIDELFDAIVKIGVDPSSLRSQIDKYMADVNRLDVVRHANSTKISPEVQSERLTIISSQINDALNFESEEAKRRQSLKVDFVTLDTKQDALKKELEQLSIQKKQLHNSLLEIDENLSKNQNNISRLREEHVTIAQTPVLTDADAKSLETLQEAIKIQHDKIACLMWA